MIGVVVSHADTASELIGDQLRATGDWTRFEDSTNPPGWGQTGYRRPGITIREFDDLHLHLDDVGTAFDDPSLVVFASRHSGDTGPLLSTHFTGNIGPAEFGGEPQTVAEPAPNAARHALTTLETLAPSGYDVTYECTHHGPSSVGAPSLFIEVGSTQSEWSDSAAADAVAQAITALSDITPHTKRTLIVIGDGHYAPRATRISQETDWAVGHVVPDWALDDLHTADTTLLETLFRSSRANHVVLADAPPETVDRIDATGHRIVSETWVRETSGIALDLVTTIEQRLGTVDDGVRFGDIAPNTTDVTVATLPSEFLDAAHGIDQTATNTAVAGTTVAYTTTDNGARVAPRFAVPTSAGREPVIQAVVDVLSEGYDSVERTDDGITLTETVFDPSLATDLGVPEGPKFGELASGNAVTIDGDTIEPGAVRTQRTHHFEL